jgi:hypothetical protein
MFVYQNFYYLMSLVVVVIVLIVRLNLARIVSLLAQHETCLCWRAKIMIRRAAANVCIMLTTGGGGGGGVL